MKTMKVSLENLLSSSRLLTAVGMLSLATIIWLQAFGAGSMASASSRDEFPRRRQGGGTHWVVIPDVDVKDVGVK